jgi:hypothetical protein
VELLGSVMLTPPRVLLMMKGRVAERRPSSLHLKRRERLWGAGREERDELTESIDSTTPHTDSCSREDEEVKGRIEGGQSPENGGLCEHLSLDVETEGGALLVLGLEGGAVAAVDLRVGTLVLSDGSVRYSRVERAGRGSEWMELLRGSTGAVTRGVEGVGVDGDAPLLREELQTVRGVARHYCDLVTILSRHLQTLIAPLQRQLRERVG